MKAITLTGESSAKDVLTQGEQEEVVVIRDGHPVAMVVPFDEEDLAWYAREHDPAFLASIARAREQVKKGKSVSHQDLKQQLGIE